MKLTEDNYLKIKDMLKLSSIGEIAFHSKDYSVAQVKLVNACDTYAEYLQSYQFQDEKNLDYLTPVTLKDLQTDIHKVLDALVRIERTVNENANL
mgnify:CR=1 FL=1